ncbi:MAG: C39 family peptidase [Solirubrobacterales bacterium]
MPGSRRAIARRRAVALAALCGVVALAVLAISGGGGDSRAGRSAPRFLRVSLGGRVLAQRHLEGPRGARAVSTLAGEVPAARTVHRGPATLKFEIRRQGLLASLERALHAGGGSVVVGERPLSASIRVPLIKQALRDDCEATALAMILAYRGRRVGQLTLQDQVAHSKPLDPVLSASGSEIWGNPSRGFVGRADGGGPAGGFGVYQGPIAALARRHGVILDDLSGDRPAALYRVLLAGHPVLAWVALSNGPFATWQTPAGETVHVNWGEHAVVLTGLGPSGVSVNDPLSGSRLTWPRPQFEQMWAALGRRALAA